MPEQAIAIETQDLSVSYRKHVAVSSLSLSVEAGKLFALLGPNGSGKSTLYKVLTTLMPPTKGSASVLGHDVVTDSSAVRGVIGVVFQHPSLDLKLSVRENLDLAGSLYGLSRQGRAKRITLLAETLGLSDHIDAYVETLSGGFARRAEIAKSLIHEPRVLLLDEPSTGLDPRARRDLNDTLRVLVREHGVSVVMTTHILEDADVADSIAMLHHGSLVALGTPEELKQEIAGSGLECRGRDMNLLSKTLIQFAPELKWRDLGFGMRAFTDNASETAEKIRANAAHTVTSVTIAQPTLEDVFLLKTGSTLNTWQGGVE